MELFSRIEGKGQPFIILHGLFGLSDNWAMLARSWSEHFEVHNIDLRNHGRSPWSDNWSYKYMAEDVLEYLNAHNISSAFVLGHSMGGKVAMQLAVDHPKRIEKLIVVDIGPKKYPTHHRSIVDALKSIDFTQMEKRSDIEGALEPKIQDLGTRQFLLKNVHRTSDGFAWRFNLNVIDQQLEEVGQSLEPDESFDSPALFIRGGKSGYILDDDLPAIHRHFPLMELKTIEGAGHWVHAEKPKEILDVVLSFLSK
jgi:esterase